MWTYLCKDSVQWQSCKHDYEPSGFIKDGEYLASTASVSCSRKDCNLEVLRLFLSYYSNKPSFPPQNSCGTKF